MFVPENGAKCLWQWDTGQRLVCSDLPAGQHVHFAYKTSERALVAEAYEEAGKVYADIPNDLLRASGGLLVYAYLADDESGYTKRCETIQVNSRPMPDDYVYTPDDIRTYKRIENKIGDLKKLETLSRENLVSAINEAAKSDGFDNHDILADITGIVTPEKLGAPDNKTDLVSYEAFQAAVPMVQQMGISEAKVGQIIKVKSVDASGHPIEWTAADVENLVLQSSTSGSTKRFKITVDDAGTLTATEITT